MRSAFLLALVLAAAAETAPATADEASPPAAAVAAIALEPPSRPPWAAELVRDAQGFAADLRVGEVVQRLRWIPPGRFTMGSPSDELDRHPEEQQRQVTLTQGFWLADSEVTQGLWEAVTGGSPSAAHGDPQRPVEQVTWHDCERFIAELNRQVPGLGAALPSEAQWEYACRAGTEGAQAGDFEAMTWHQGNSASAPQAVRQRTPNAWGLYDMHGNVWEWCADWHDDEVKPDPVTDPIGPDSGTKRIERGGGHCNGKDWNRAAARFGVPPEAKYANLGLRLAVVAATAGSAP